jgi:hypothetical protein
MPLNKELDLILASALENTVHVPEESHVIIHVIIDDISYDACQKIAQEVVRRLKSTDSHTS